MIQIIRVNILLVMLGVLINPTIIHASEADFVEVKLHITNAHMDIKYASHDNFVGTPIKGYQAAKCLLHKNAIADLKRAAVELQEKGYRLRIFDCYRPEKAVAHFMRWANDINDVQTKERYYPNIEKPKLVGPYIAEKSGHSKGYTIDLSLEQNINGQWHELDMGGIFDLFDARSNTLHPDISKVQKNNRAILVTALEAHGFKNYAMEWWHFTYIKTPKHLRSQAYDFDIQ
jgi:zinc D-Ala-D-Ala dipeptidase